MALTVNGEKIEDKIIQEESERLRPEYEQVFAEMAAEERESQLLEWSKENVIEKVILRQYAEKNSGDVEESEIQAAISHLSEEYTKRGQDFAKLSEEDKGNIRRDIELQIKIEKVLRGFYEKLPEPGQEEIEKCYRENIEHFKSPEQIRVAHIVKHISWQSDEGTAESMIRQAQEELQGGALFESIAAKHSDCPDKGGDLGYITKGQMVEEFEDVVFNLNPGQISDVFRTRFGFHIAKVYDRKASVTQSLEDVTESIVRELKQRKQNEAIEGFLDDLRSKAEIEGE
ncbi:MAG: peptidylprolyl isomerase [Planctomycetota bacterium]|jgi:parvulin-like peptidyl-prolyl isomerase